MINPAQPPEGILDPQQPWWPADRVGPQIWLRLKGKLTGRPIAEMSGERHTSYVKLGDADADRLIENIKKYGKYPQVNQNDKYGGAYNAEAYQKWLVEEFLEKPFRENVDKKIEEQQIESRLKEIQETKSEIKEADTPEEVVAVIDDKIEVLEEIREQVAPPPTEYKIPDPWEGSYTTPDSKKKNKPKRRKLKTPKGVVKRPKKKPTSKKKKPTVPTPPPESRRKRFGRMVGGGLKNAGGYIGKTLFSGGAGGGGAGKAPGEGPSVLAMGSWLGKKVKKAFQDAKEQKERALEAQSNGAEIPPEALEPGYFIKKSIGYQFGGRAFDTTFGAFIENMPSKQSRSKAGFGDQFDYGDADPAKKKKKTNELRDLATGFRKVSIALSNINKQITKQTQTLSQLVTSSERNADLLEGISNSISGLVAVEIDSGSDEIQAQQAAGDINIPSIDLGGLFGKSEDGLDWFDMLMAADDIRDIRKGLKDGKVKTTRRSGGKPKITGDVTPRRRFRMPSFGRRMKFSQGTAGVTTQVPALIGEAGPEVLVRGGMQKLAEGGVMQGTGSNILATGLGAAGDLMKKVQPFANVMEVAFQVIGAHISGALSNLVSAAGPFSGVIAKMFSPLLGGLATVFGLNQGAFAAELNSSAMTEKQGAKELSRFFARFFKIFGINITDDSEQTDDDNGDNNATSADAGDYKELLDMIAGKESASAGGYIAYNEGGSNNGYKVVGYGGPSDQGPLKRKLTDMTVAEIMQHQKDKDPPIHAAGRYQIIGSTLDGLINRKSYGETGVSPNDKFNASTQDKLGIALIKYRLKTGANVDNFISEWRGLKFENREKLQKAIDKAKGASTQAARGVVKPTSFLNQVQGVFEITGPDSGYRVPEELTGGQPVIGHGLEWLVKMSNKFIILPGVNKEYNVYQNPEKAFARYEQIGQQGGVEVAGLVDFIDKMIFSSPKTGKPVRYQTGPRDAIEAIGGKYYAPYGPDSSFKPVRGAMLNNDMPEGNVMPLPIPKDTVSGTSVAMIQTVTPVIQQVPVYIKGDTQYIHVPANPLVAGREKARLSHYKEIS